MERHVAVSKGDGDNAMETPPQGGGRANTLLVDFDSTLIQKTLTSLRPSMVGRRSSAKRSLLSFGNSVGK